MDHYLTRDNAPVRYEQLVARHASLNAILDGLERVQLPDGPQVAAVMRAHEHLSAERAAVRRELERRRGNAELRAYATS